MAPNALIDIAQADLNLKNCNHEIQSLCLENNTYIVNHKVVNHRIYLDLTI